MGRKGIGNWTTRKGFASAGFELKALLVGKGLTGAEVVRRLHGRGWGISTHMFYQLTAGEIGTTPARWNLILDACEVTMEERFRLHQCAARDMGWLIGQMPAKHLVRRVSNVWNRVPRAQWKIRAPKYNVKKVTVDIVPVAWDRLPPKFSWDDFTPKKGDCNGAAARDLGSDRPAGLLQCEGRERQDAASPAHPLGDGTRINGVEIGPDQSAPERAAPGDDGDPVNT